jgi:aminomethyltransferase
MVDFAGWHMPVQYASITEEHRAVRRAAGLFDIAHMGRIYFTGPDACRFLDHVLTNDVQGLRIGKIRYSLAVNEAGGILDDVLVYRFADFYALVVNASNREKILDWIEEHRPGFDAAATDRTLQTSMLAIQGPRALDILGPFVEAPIARLKYYTAVESRVLGQPAIVSRTGYTGEDGFEVITPAGAGEALWKALFEEGKPRGMLPAGLGCRDTLRLEAAMPLYGHELDETVDPFTAGLAFAVKSAKPSVVGRDALIAAEKRTDRPVRVGLELSSRRIARENAPILAGEAVVGRVTSGTFSPTLEKSIAMGYVAGAHAALGAAVEVDVRGKRESAVIVKLPFYTRA